ncbi:MAG: 3-oxoacyl-[acyl-carrier-protein] reductase [Bacillota bacterium]
MSIGSRVALVTGASKGIGRACAVRLAKSGYDIAVNYLRDEEGARETARMVEAEGVRAEVFQCDVSSFTDSQNLIDRIEKELGPIQVVVCNAGLNKDALFMRMTEEDWDLVIDTNLKGVFNVTRWAARPMARRKRGRIISISSVVGFTGNPGQANYAASKAGILGLTRTLAKELARYTITANVVAPGYILSEMTDKLPTEIQEKLKNQIPLGRPGTAEDVAHAVAFLASDDAAYITGQVLIVDGGMSTGNI